MIAAARTLLLAKGHADTTMKDVAATAGVSVETVYKAFGGKAALLKRVYDVLLVGDEEQMPLRQRPEILAIATKPDPRDKNARYAGIARTTPNGSAVRPVSWRGSRIGVYYGQTSTDATPATWRGL